MMWLENVIINKFYLLFVKISLIILNITIILFGNEIKILIFYSLIKTINKTFN